MNPYPGPPPGGGYGMPPPGPYYPQPSPPRSLEDVQHLNLLAVLHFVYAGLIALVGLFFGIYIVMGVMLATDPSISASGGPSPAAIGGVFAAIGAIAMILMWTKAALLIWSGVSLRAHRRWTLSFVVACISSLNIPIGTALGVFTIVVLSRPSVKAMFQEAELARM